MKTKLFIFNLIILFTILLFIGNFNSLEASIKRNNPINNVSKAEREISDIVILQSIKEIISDYDPMLIKNINITLNRGIVSILGIVKTLNDKEKTISIIKTVRGVRGVIDYTILTPIVSCDKDINNDIVVSFLHNPIVYAPRVKINVLDAVVTLSGFVANIQEKHEAVKVAKGIVGVLEIKDYLFIDPNIKLSNIELKDAIKAILSNDIYLFNNIITIRINQEEIVLQGIVDTPFEKMRATIEIAKLGVKGIDNQLLISENIHGYIQMNNLSVDDPSIKNAIEDIIQFDERIAPQHFDISVKDGVVKLQGTVNDIYQKWYIEQDILNLPGVHFVKNYLFFKKLTRDDNDIINDINRILRCEPSLVNSDIIITCKAGEVTIHGEIDTNINRALAEDIVGRISGIEKIFNHLQIENNKRSHMKFVSMTESVNPHDIINWDMNIDNDIFKIYVDRGHKIIIIRGKVKDLEQKIKAEELLKLRAPTNFSIINEISITDYF